MKTFDEIIAARRKERKKYGTDITRISHMIPEFLHHMDTYSPMLSASYAGFSWGTWRRALLTRQDVAEKYAKYIEAIEHRRNGLSGWTS